MRYHLTPATPADGPWLEALRRAAYQELFLATWGHWDEARHQRQWADCWARGDIQLVEFGGERIGMIQLHEHADRVEISEIQIQPSAQGRGIGSRLVRDVQAQAHTQRRKVSLSTGLANHRAVRLYERLGFTEASRSDTHVHMESAPPAPGSPP